MTWLVFLDDRELADLLIFAWAEQARRVHLRSLEVPTKEEA